MSEVETAVTIPLALKTPYQVWTMQAEEPRSWLGGALDVNGATIIAAAAAEILRVAVAVLDPDGSVVAFIGYMQRDPDASQEP